MKLEPNFEIVVHDPDGQVDTETIVESISNELAKRGIQRVAFYDTSHGGVVIAYTGSKPPLEAVIAMMDQEGML